MRLDMLVDHKVIIEVKTTEKVLAVHKAQVLTHLRLTNLKLGNDIFSYVAPYDQKSLLELSARCLN